MDRIQLNENRTGGASVQLLVSPKHHRLLERYSTAGGFLRYTIDFLADGIRGTSEKEKLKSFFYNVFPTEEERATMRRIYELYFM
jgi:hypothetical protein